MIRAILGALCAAAALSTAAAREDEVAPRVRTTQGVVAGARSDDVERFLAIPYAASPVGGRRWRPPGPAPRWQGARDASVMGPACPQPVRPAAVAGGVADRQSEDCLQLNLWRPAGARRLPVLVWIHGGAHVIGSGTFPVFDGTALARQGLIVVTINYRLGLLGYFAHPSLTAELPKDAPLGNYGLMDQIAALQWVQKHIADFGGDPRQVTVMGESAGAISTMTLLANPRARGLFARAILQSGIGLLDPATLEQQEAAGIAAAERAGLPKTADADALRVLPAERWVEALGQRSGGAVNPFIDGRLIREPPWSAFQRDAAIDVPMLVGANSNEASVLLAMGVPPAAALRYVGGDMAAARAAYGAGLDEAEMARQVLGDAWFVAPARWLASVTARGAPTYLYHFNYVASGRRAASKGAPHGSEIPYIFGTLDYLKKVVGPASPEDRAFSRGISACWASFAKSGRPDCALVPAWPRYRSDTDELALFAAQSKLAGKYRKAQIDLLLRVHFGSAGRQSGKSADHPAIQRRDGF